jgi:8-amino-7-oxononanoate synthase
MGMTRSHRSRTIESPVGPRIAIDGKAYINFGGSSYLGLSLSPEILEAGTAMLRRYGAGTPIPRDHGFATCAHEEVEAEGSRFFDVQAALYLASGYYFGLISMAAIKADCNAVFFDEFSHYSLREGIAATGLRSYAFRHLDAEDLAVNLKRHLLPGERPVIATDGLFPTLGHIAPLGDLAKAAAPYGGRLIVDESHSFGVLGATGRGAIEHHALSREAVLVGGSTGKAFAAAGGIILGSEDEIAKFRGTPAGRGATVGMPAAAAMCAASLRYVRLHPELLCQLRENIAYMKRGLRNMGLAIAQDVAPIIALELGDAAAMRSLKQALMSEGVHVYHSTYVGAGKGGVIRCAVFADHTAAEMDALFSALRKHL